MRRASDRWISLSLSVLLHGALLGALVYGCLMYGRRPGHGPARAMEARVCVEKGMKGAQQAPVPPEPAPEPAPLEEPPAEPQGPPPPTADELAQREEERQKADAAV